MQLGGLVSGLSIGRSTSVLTLRNWRVHGVFLARCQLARSARLNAGFTHSFSGQLTASQRTSNLNCTRLPDGDTVRITALPVHLPELDVVGRVARRWYCP